MTWRLGRLAPLLLLTSLPLGCSPAGREVAGDDESTRMKQGGVSPLGEPGSLALSEADARSVRDGIYTVEQARRGEEAYRVSCASCHLPGLEGDGVSPPLKGSAFIQRWQGLGVSDLVASIRSTMPQNAPFSLPAQTYRDIIAYLLEANGSPPGESEMGEEVEVVPVELKWEGSPPAGF